VLRPVLAVQTPSGFETRVADLPIRVTPALAFGFDKIRPGTPFSIGLVVGDVGDQRDATFADGRVP
jgi:hypothetical protein